MAVNTLSLSSEEYNRVASYFVNNVFVPGHGPDFYVWMAEQFNAELHPDSWSVTFKTEKDYNWFVLRWSL
jgi:hypothetical protein